ncbi:hypothetical protein ASPZODRAFT_523758 [Penicilliopsis zonata CBS 506.65]|uniref:Major facilitator superfamily (MFS) profile domain-containing protein n=1 Tax=Penicilliopsis zonata CBS 506.65 TaxID=1073090 RepID=A0A1L9SEY3_9EURO|nr:hypothetical protein ASPZODRAFT_523758 [Penicilliopsis zonata CBS 506.65]OJJ45770.1 hypothetical protein ASPZODRAFT_523758 [Penicilliopsis zonata CBS 506.65]
MAEVSHTYDESTPLLAIGQRSPRESRKRWLVLFISSLLILGADLGVTISSTPQLEIFEEILCHNYYGSHDGPAGTMIDERLCKSAEVQTELALINGWKDTWDLVPGIALSLPYGVLSDHWGRRPVFMLSLLGIMLGELWVRIVCFFPNVFSLRLVWLSALPKIIGGGDRVAASMAMVMIADLFSEEERATALFRLFTFVLISEILGMPISAYLMRFTPWLPFNLGLGIAMVSSLFVFCIPETLTDAKEKMRQSSTPAVNEEDAVLEESSKDATVLQAILHRARRLQEALGFIWSDAAIVISLFGLFISPLVRLMTPVLLQYASKKFDWNLAQASLLLSLRGGFSLGNYVILMPALSSWITTHLRMPAQWKDLRLAQANVLLSIVGLFIVFLAGSPATLMTGLVFVALGFGFPIVCWSFVTSRVPADHVGTLYAAGSVMTAFGGIVMLPAVTYAFRFGLHLGNAWLGLPFLLAALLYFLVFVAFLFIRLEKRVDINEAGVHVGELSLQEHLEDSS